MKTYQAAGALVALAMGVAAHAEDAPGTIIVTGQAQAESEVAATPGGADLVTADQYRDRLAVSLRDALAFSPGVYAQPRFGQEVRLSIRATRIRGELLR